MKSEINKEILKFRERWKYHNLSVISGFIFFMLSIAIMVLTIYTILFYEGDNHLYCVFTEVIMYLVAKKLYKNTMPDKETRMLYISEYYQLVNKIQSITKSEIDNTFNNIIEALKEKKRDEK